MLELPIEKIHIAETSTSSIANASPSAGSVACDLVAPAVKVCHFDSLVDNVLTC